MAAGRLQLKPAKANVWPRSCAAAGERSQLLHAPQAQGATQHGSIDEGGSHELRALNTRMCNCRTHAIRMLRLVAELQCMAMARCAVRPKP
mgnify:CR=1 FL=1